jgi:hypothetical protein
MGAQGAPGGLSSVPTTYFHKAAREAASHRQKTRNRRTRASPTTDNVAMQKVGMVHATTD